MRAIHEILSDREPYSVQKGQTVAAVVRYMVEKRIGAVAVCDRDRVVGVFSERDLMRRVVDGGLPPLDTIVDDVMTKDVVSVSAEERSSVARALMMGKNFRHLVVIDAAGQLRGFVSIRDLLEEDLAESRELIAKLNDGYYQHDFVPPDSYSK